MNRRNENNKQKDAKLIEDVMTKQWLTRVECIYTDIVHSNVIKDMIKHSVSADSN